MAVEIRRPFERYPKELEEIVLLSNESLIKVMMYYSIKRYEILRTDTKLLGLSLKK